MSAFETFDAEPFDPPVPLEGWATVDSVLAWIAFGSAIPELGWDRAIYFGASDWCDCHPRLIPQLLNFLKNAPENTSGLSPLLRFHLLHPLYEDVMPATRAQDLDMLAAAAKSKVEAPTFPAEMARAEKRYEAIRAAAEDLRQRLARADLAIFGRRGESETSLDSVATARERIPAEVFRAPVTVSGRGVLPVVRDHDRSDMYKALFSDLLLDGSEVLKIWPGVRPDGSRPQTLLERAPPASKGKREFSKRALEDFMKERDRTWPEGRPPPTEAEDWHAACEAMGAEVPRDRVRALRPPHWRKPGPKNSRG